MLHSSQDSSVSTVLGELSRAQDSLTSLGPTVNQLNDNAAVLLEGTKALCGSLRQIVMISRNNGSIQHDKVIEILSKNGVLDFKKSNE